MRAASVDTASGKAGVVAQRLVVSEPGSFRISTPILSDMMSGPSGGKKTHDPAAIAHRQFAAGSGRPLRCHFEVFGAAKDSSTQRADVTVRLSVTDWQGRIVSAAPPTRIVSAVDGRLRQLIALPLRELPAGEYQLALVVEDHVAAKSDESHESFVVATGPDPGRTVQQTASGGTLGYVQLANVYEPEPSARLR